MEDNFVVYIRLCSPFSLLFCFLAGLPSIKTGLAGCCWTAISLMSSTESAASPRLTWLLLLLLLLLVKEWERTKEKRPSTQHRRVLYANAYPRVAALIAQAMKGSRKIHILFSTQYIYIYIYTSLLLHEILTAFSFTNIIWNFQPERDTVFRWTMNVKFDVAVGYIYWLEFLIFTSLFFVSIVYFKTPLFSLADDFYQSAVYK